MVRAILAGRKTQTRRIVKPQPPAEYPYVLAKTMLRSENGEAFWTDAPGDDDMMGYWPSYEKGIPCPYGTPCDRLWVRETWFVRDCGRRCTLTEDVHKSRLLYCADCTPMAYETRSPIHMFRWASRIDLEVTGVRVERVQDISEADAQAEGISVLPLQDPTDPSAWWQSAPGVHQARNARDAFAMLWDSINKKPRLRGEDQQRCIDLGSGWDANPWVWVIDFKWLT